MKITALGVNSAFAVGAWMKPALGGRDYYLPKFQSNFLITFKQPGKVRDNLYRFVLDFGGDIRHSLSFHGLSVADIDGWYCSHPHNDHVGGIEGIALSTIFHPAWNKAKQDWHKGQGLDKLITKKNPDGTRHMIPDAAKPDLYAHAHVIPEIWATAKQGLDTLQGVPNVCLEDYFQVHTMVDNNPIYFKDEDRTWEIFTVVSTHVVAGMKLMPSYGLLFNCDDGQKVYMPTDTQFMTPPQIRMFYEQSDVVYQDCETGFRSGVHAHIDDLRKYDPSVKEKMYLYHYNEEPEVDEGEFKGVLKMGEVHDY